MIFERLRAIGLSNITTSRNETDNGWRIRTDGGLVAHVYDDGRLAFFGRNARLVRKALGNARRS